MVDAANSCLDGSALGSCFFAYALKYLRPDSAAIYAQDQRVSGHPPVREEDDDQPVVTTWVLTIVTSFDYSQSVVMPKPVRKRTGRLNPSQACLR